MMVMTIRKRKIGDDDGDCDGYTVIMVIMIMMELEKMIPVGFLL